MPRKSSMSKWQQKFLNERNMTYPGGHHYDFYHDELSYAQARQLIQLLLAGADKTELNKFYQKQGVSAEKY